MTEEERAVWLLTYHAAISGGRNNNNAARMADAAIAQARKRGVIK